MPVSDSAAKEEWRGTMTQPCFTRCSQPNKTHWFYSKNLGSTFRPEGHGNQ